MASHAYFDEHVIEQSCHKIKFVTDGAYNGGALARFIYYRPRSYSMPMYFMNKKGSFREGKTLEIFSAKVTSAFIVCVSLSLSRYCKFKFYSFEIFLFVFSSFQFLQAREFQGKCVSVRNESRTKPRILLSTLP